MSLTNIQRIKTIINADFSEIKALLSQLHTGYLVDVGWFNTFNTKQAVDKNGNPIPWTTYPFIDFISLRLNSNIVMFEYGCGSSTLFFSKYVKEITSIEHNEVWFNKIKDAATSNVFLNYIALDENGLYCRQSHFTNKKFDLIFIDAEDRVNCILQSAGSLSESGVLVLDDSERNEYKEGVEFMINEGFKKLDFWGIAPTILFKKCTTLFYRENNCLKV